MPKSINLFDGCTLFKRKDSSKWWARIKIDDGEWERYTTGERDLNKAKKKAHKIYYEVEFATEHNLPQRTRTFSQIAKTIIKELEGKKDTEYWKPTYKDYLIVLEKHLIPYFGQYHITNLQQPYLGYFDYLTEKLERSPAQSTMRNHNGAMNLVFTKALQHRYVLDYQLPKLEVRGKASERRPSIDLDEYFDLIRKLRAWCNKKQRLKRSVPVRKLLFDYVMVLANTGIRPGEEMMRMEWRHIFWRKGNQSGENRLRINVWTRKGRNPRNKMRTVVARDSAIKAFKRIHQRDPKLSKLTFDELLAKKLQIKVFQLPDGSQPSRLDLVLKKFLKEHNLLKGSEGDADRTLYSFRHYYATKELTREGNIGIKALADQMGTSVDVIERHYSHLNLDDLADQIAGEPFVFGDKKNAESDEHR